MSITSANASFILVIPGVFSSGVQLQGFAVDDMFSMDPTTLAEGRRGADGQTVYGYVYELSKMRIGLLANSNAFRIFQAWKQAQDAAVDVITASGTIIMPSLGLKTSLVDGNCTNLAAFPPHKKVAENVEPEVTWGSWTTTATN
jgi:hypothetical protein